MPVLSTPSKSHIPTCHLKGHSHLEINLIRSLLAQLQWDLQPFREYSNTFIQTPNMSDSKNTMYTDNNVTYNRFSSVAQSCLTLWDTMDCSTPGFPVHQPLPKLLKLMSIESVMPSNHLILCHPLLLLPSIFLSLRVFSNDSVLLIRWPKYWSFSFSISPSDEYMTYNTICYAYNLTSQIEKLRSRNSQIA